MNMFCKLVGIRYLFIHLGLFCFETYENELSNVLSLGQTSRWEFRNSIIPNLLYDINKTLKLCIRQLMSKTMFLYYTQSFVLRYDVLYKATTYSTSSSSSYDYIKPLLSKDKRCEIKQK